MFLIVSVKFFYFLELHEKCTWNIAGMKSFLLENKDSW